MKTVGNSDIGMRREKNEDSFRFGSFNDGVVWAVVCDGMGGAAAGERASSIATEVIGEKIQKCYNHSMSEKSLENLLLSAITTANVAVYDTAEADPSLSGMGTTVVAAIIKNNIATVAHVGDSRAYYISGQNISQITKDHSLVQEMYDNGQITKEELENHPNKNIITRVLGLREKVEIDFDTVYMSSQDALILCSDGLSGCVNDEKLLEIYENNEFESIAARYIEAANDAGGPDNITVVAMLCE